MTALMQAAWDSYAGRKTAGLELLVRRELRKGLKDQLIAVKDAISTREAALARTGNNLNQLTRFCHRYIELPVGLTAALVEAAAAHRAHAEEIRRLREAIDNAVGDADE